MAMYSASQAIAIVNLIEKLRAEEGDSVDILCDNPDPQTGDEAVGVDCYGDWCCGNDPELWMRGVRFYGRDLEAALTAAYHARKSAGGDVEDKQATEHDDDNQQD